MQLGDTIAAIATAPGKSGVAVVRVSGPDAFAVGEKLIGGKRPIVGGERPTLAMLKDGDLPIDQALVLAFKNPKSYTGEDVVEFQCHGGAIVPRRVLDACLKAGARMARRGEFTERAFLNGKLKFEQAEAVLNLINAKTERAASVALDEFAGTGKAKRFHDLYERALAISTELEYALDVDEGELPNGFMEGIVARIGELDASLGREIDKARKGRILNEGALVVLAGRPNAGKSSLMNALLEENRAIVSDVPGTTRDPIEEYLDLDGYPVRLVDTAGIRESVDAIEMEGVKRAEAFVAKADLVIVLGDDDLSIPDARKLVVHSKCDLERGVWLNVSAKTGEGIDELKREIVRRIEQLEPSVEPDGVDRLLEARMALAGVNGEAVIAANCTRKCAETLGKLVGATYSDDMLERLFSKFCVGK